jgi:HK97 family phage major capsid protein
MHKFKCSKCDHAADTKGFCPVDGTELSEASPMSDELKGLLDRIGDVVKERTEDTLKAMGFDGTPERKLLGDPKTADEKMAFVKGLLGEKDQKMLNALPSEKHADFLRKAKVGLFFKHLVALANTGDQAHRDVVKALSEGDDASGGYLVPTEFRAELIEDIKDKPVMRNLVTVIPMSTDSLELPTLASDVKTSWGSENTAISTTTARFGTLTFTPYRLNTMMYTSRELVADSAIAIVPLITRLFVAAIGRAEDTAIINGNGSGQPTGIMNGIASISGIDNANVDADLAANLKKLPFRLGTAYRANARWVMNSITLAAIASLKDSNGQFLFKEGIEGLSPHRLAGYPVFEQNDMPLDTILFGDFSYYYLADREQMSVETTTQGAGTFEKHQVAIKVVERIDGKVALTNAFKKLTNAGVD